MTDKKIRAINSGMQINNISNLLDKSAYSPDNSKHSKSDSKHLKADLIYLNFWSEYINQQLIDYNVMYHNAHNSLHDIDAILQLLLDKNISKRCKQQIANYQNAYNTIVSKQKK